MLTTQFKRAEEGITVPYEPVSDDIRNNGGFVDTRGRPDLVAQIHEATKSSALRALLLAFAEPGSPYFSLGCDLGVHVDAEVSGYSRVAGGYIQFMNVNCHTTPAMTYFEQAKFVSRYVESKSLNRVWHLDHLCISVKFLLDGHTEIIPSLWIWFYARGRTPSLALQSREALIGALHEAII